MTDLDPDMMYSLAIEKVAADARKSESENRRKWATSHAHTGKSGPLGMSEPLELPEIADGQFYYHIPGLPEFDYWFSIQVSSIVKPPFEWRVGSPSNVYESDSAVRGRSETLVEAKRQSVHALVMAFREVNEQGTA